MAFKNKTSVFGILLFIIILASFFTTASTWKYWGGEINPIWFIQGEGNGVITNSSLINVNTSSSYIASDNYVTLEPLVYSPNTSANNQNYMIFPNGNYLQLYNKDMLLSSEINTGGYAKGQISASSTFYSGTGNEINGFWNVNSSMYKFVTYYFDSATQTFQNVYELNFTDNLNITGVRCYDFATPACLAWVFDWNTTYTNNYSISLRKIFNNGSYQDKLIENSAFVPINLPAIQDWDVDGVNEVLGYSSNDIWVANVDTLTSEINMSMGKIGEVNRIIGGATFYKPSLSPYYNLAVFMGSSGVSTAHEVSLKVYKNDKSLLYSKTFASYAGGAVNHIEIPNNLIVGDWNANNLDDLGLSYSSTLIVPSYPSSIYIVNGYDGSTIFSKSGIDGHIIGAKLTPYSFALAYDVLTNDGSNLKIFSGNNFSNVTSYSLSTTNAIVADMDFNGGNDLIFYRSGLSGYLTANNINNNPTIYSLAFSPSTTIAVNIPLNILINASDNESDSILYSSVCGDGTNVTESLNSVQTCNYASAGTYTYTAYVRDGYHFTFNSFSYPITVTISGTICNLNGICDAGETSINCPSDCPVAPSGQYTTSNETGGMPLPIQLVDTSQEYAIGQEVGFLPEIYYGLLGFFSNTLSPMIVMVFLFFIVLIIVAIGYFIKSVAHKIGNIGH